MWFLWKLTLFSYQYRVNIQIPHKIASISAIIPLGQTEAATAVQDLPIGALLQRLPRSLHHRPNNSRAKGQNHVDLGPSFFSSSVAKRIAVYYNALEGNSLNLL